MTSALPRSRSGSVVFSRRKSAVTSNDGSNGSDGRGGGLLESVSFVRGISGRGGGGGGGGGGVGNGGGGGSGGGGSVDDGQRLIAEEEGAAYELQIYSGESQRQLYLQPNGPVGGGKSMT